MGHIVLLGDSIFDNAAYVPGGPSVIEHLRRLLPAGWKATLLAQDGSVAAAVERQLTHLPPDATHLVISTGGNNALLSSSSIEGVPARTMDQALTRLSDVCADFQQEYRRMLEAVVAKGLPITLCTIYEGVPGLERWARTGLATFNERILLEAFRARVSAVIDLRLTCDEPSDYSSVSPIEPSASGGRKIARAIQRATIETESLGTRVVV